VEKNAIIREYKSKEKGEKGESKNENGNVDFSEFLDVYSTSSNSTDSDQECPRCHELSYNSEGICRYCGGERVRRGSRR
jgi:hypothetical protein